MTTVGVGTDAQQARLDELADSGLGDSGLGSADALDSKVEAVAQHALNTDEDIVSRLLPLYSVLSSDELTSLADALERGYVPGPFMEVYLQRIVTAYPSEETARVQAWASAYFQHASSAQAPNGHRMFIDLAAALGYAVSQTGMCYGVACMGLMAATEGKLREFDECLKTVAQLAHQNGYDMQKVKIELSLPENQGLSYEIQALFEGISLFHDAENYLAWLSPNQTLKSQRCVELVAPLVTENSQVKKVREPFSGAYRLEDLRKVFKQLKEASITAHAPLNILVADLVHSIGVFYNPHQKRWYFLDANRLPIQMIESETQLAELVFRTLCRQNTPRGGISMEIFSRQRDAGALEQALLYKRKSKGWKNLKCFQARAERLIHAAMNHELFVLQKCLQQGVDVNRSEEERNALQEATCRGDLEIMKELLAAENISVDIRGYKKLTPLMWACIRGETAAMLLLLDHGADITLTNDQGRTPLMLAARQGNAELVRILLDRGADPTKRDTYGCTAAMHGALFGNKATIGMLVQRVSADEAGDLFLLAAEGSNIGVMEALLDHGVNIDVQGVHGWTALMGAVNRAQKKAVQFLLARGVNKQLVSRGETALMIAQQKGYTELVTLLESS